MLPHAESIEASVKDTTCCTLPGRDKIVMPLISSMRHILHHDSKNNTLNDEDYECLNEKNANASECLPGKSLNKKIIK